MGSLYDQDTAFISSSKNFALSSYVDYNHISGIMSTPKANLNKSFLSPPSSSKNKVEIAGIVYKESKSLYKKVELPLWNELTKTDVISIGNIHVKENANILTSLYKVMARKRCCIVKSGHLLIYSCSSEKKGHLLDLKKIVKIVFEGYNKNCESKRFVSIKLKWAFGSVELALHENEIDTWKEPIFRIHERCGVFAFDSSFNFSTKRKSIFETTLNDDLEPYFNSADDSVDDDIFNTSFLAAHSSGAETDIHQPKMLHTNSSIISEDGLRFDTPRPMVTEQKIEGEGDGGTFPTSRGVLLAKNP
uniref:PH domain-containing protein n=1 Tax=Rhabditophanes sp. KR3021 TaxID=114890 RepID=A0AC35UI96_9BILA